MFNLEDYETVEERLAKFWLDHPEGKVLTRLLDHHSGRFIVEAAIYRKSEDTSPYAMGLAEETVQGRGVNSTSALENCETSAIGRALANGGYAAKGKRPSREEMSKVAAQKATSEKIEQTRQALAETASTPVTIANPSDPWTTWEKPQAVTVASAVEMIADHIEGNILGEVPNCKCGKAMSWRTGEKNGRQWAHYACTNVPSRKCMDPIWYVISSDGTWKPQEKK